MTDQRTPDELESRLRNGFRRGALPEAPDTLRAALERVPDGPVDIGRVNGHRRSGSGTRSGWGVIGLAAVLALSGAVALAVGQRSPSPVPAPLPSDRASSVDPSPAGGTRITYEAVWPADHPANAGDIAAIGTILRKRLDATGLTGYALESAGGSRFTLDLPAAVDADAIRGFLGTTGFVVAVPSGDTAPDVGSALDPAQSARLFDSAGIESASVRMGQAGTLVLRVDLDPAAARDFAAWTAANVGGYVAIAIDGIVVTAPTIVTKIPDGQIEISISDGAPGLTAEAASRVAAIIEPGPLPVPIREVSVETLPGASPPVPVATGPVPESPNPVTFDLSPLRSDLGCDTIPAPYESFVFHIDPTAAETVWAIADTGARLRTEWGSSFRGRVGPPANVVDDRGLSIADGHVVQTPNGAWPVIGGHFVCPSGEMISIFDEPPPA